MGKHVYNSLFIDPGPRWPDVRSRRYSATLLSLASRDVHDELSELVGIAGTLRSGHVLNMACDGPKG